MKRTQVWAKRTRVALASLKRVIQESRQFRARIEAPESETDLSSGRFTPAALAENPRDAESLDVWGFKDTRFFINSNGNVELSGDRYALSGNELPKLLPWIEKILGMSIEARDSRVSHYPPSLPAPVKNRGFLQRIAAICKPDQYTDDGPLRLRHGHGHTQEEMYMVKYGRVHRIPDLVVYPENEAQVVALVAAASDENVCLIPYGGGTNVTEALRCPEDETRMIVSVDMRRMNRILWIDPVNRMACIEAGAVGRHIVSQLAEHGYTMGHEPDSVEFSTLGGWIATHASGMKKNKYGNIENIVVDMNVVGAAGLVTRSSAGPRESVGIDPRLWLFGSEGGLGIVTQAIVKLFPLPAVKNYGSVLFPTFEDGVHFMYELSQQSAWPASARLVDNLQFQLSMALKPADKEPSVWRTRKSNLQKLYVTRLKGFDPDRMVACTLVFEGEAAEVAEQESMVYELARRHGGMKGGGENGERGYQLTFGIAYIRDFMMNHYLMAESFETSMPWTSVLSLCENVKRRIAEEHAARKLPGNPFVTCRVTQLYKTGAVVYFYCAFYARGVENPDQVFNEIEHAARDEILKCGGSLSHHHGVGKLRRQYMPQILSPAGLAWKNGMKQAVDPQNIFGVGNQALEAPRRAAPMTALKIGFWRRLWLALTGWFRKAPPPESRAHAAAVAAAPEAPKALPAAVRAPEPALRDANGTSPDRSPPSAAVAVVNASGPSQARLIAPSLNLQEANKPRDNYFRDRVFVVTGASSGIGRSLVIALARKGARVVAMARSEDRLRELQMRTNQWIVKGDVSIEADCRFAVESAVREFGRLDGVIHNAGISMRGLAEDTDLSVIHSLLGTNFFPLVYFFQSAIPHLRQSRGHFVGVSSMMGHFATQMRSGYCASKHAVQGYLNSIRLETAADGVHVMGVAPGFVRTEITRRALNNQGEAHAEESHNTAGGMSPEEVATWILRGIEQRKREVYPARFRERAGLALSRLTPAVLDRIILKSSVT